MLLGGMKWIKLFEEFGMEQMGKNYNTYEDKFSKLMRYDSTLPVLVLHSASLRLLIDYTKIIY